MTLFSRIVNGLILFFVIRAVVNWFVKSKPIVWSFSVSSKKVYDKIDKIFEIKKVSKEEREKIEKILDETEITFIWSFGIAFVSTYYGTRTFLIGRKNPFLLNIQIGDSEYPQFYYRVYQRLDKNFGQVITGYIVGKDKFGGDKDLDILFNFPVAFLTPPIVKNTKTKWYKKSLKIAEKLYGLKMEKYDWEPWPGVNDDFGEVAFIPTSIDYKSENFECDVEDADN